MMYQDSRDLPQLAKNDFPLKALVEACEEVLSLGLNQCKLSRLKWATFLIKRICFWL